MQLEFVANLLRFTILSQYFAPEPGAPHVRLPYLAKELQWRGREVTVVTAFPKTRKAESSRRIDANGSGARKPRE